MASEPVLGWDARCVIAAESTFGTTPDWASADAIEAINLDMGPTEVGNTRAQKDKTQGRGMTSKFVEGRVDPIAFTLDTSVKSRAAVDTVPKESVLYRAGGLVQAVNGGASVTYTLSSNPTPPSMSALRVLGTDPTAYHGEQGRGGVIRKLTWAGGDQELNLKAEGLFIGKNHAGYIDSITLADGVGTSLTVSVAEAFRLSANMFMKCESEVFKITSVNYATGVCVIARAQLGTSGAAHAAKPTWPHIPTLTLAGSPISEANVVVNIDGTATRCTKFQLEFTTGVDMLPGESGSRYIQGKKVVRCDVKGTASLVLKREDVTFLGKITQRDAMAFNIVCGTGAGGIVTLNVPFCEMMPTTVPDTQNDVVVCDIEFRARDNAGNDILDITLT